MQQFLASKSRNTLSTTSIHWSLMSTSSSSSDVSRKSMHARTSMGNNKYREGENVKI